MPLPLGLDTPRHPSFSRYDDGDQQARLFASGNKNPELTCHLAMVTHENYCGPIGKGRTVCIDKGTCKVTAHSKNRADPALDFGLFIQLKPGIVLAVPMAPALVAHKYAPALEKLQKGAPKAVLSAVLHTMNELENTTLTDDEKVRDLEAFIQSVGRYTTADGKIDRAAVMLSPQKPGKGTGNLKVGSDSDEEDLQDDAKRALRYAARVKEDLDALLTAQRMMQGVVGQSVPIDLPLTSSINVLAEEVDNLTGDVEHVNDELDKVAHSTVLIGEKLKAHERTFSAQGERLGTVETRVVEQRSDLDGMLENVHGLMNYLEHTHGAGGGGQIGDEAVLRARLDKMERKLQATEGGVCEYSLDGGTFTFASSRDLEAFAGLLPKNTPEKMNFDPVVLLSRLGNQTVSEEEVQQAEVHSQRVKRRSAYTQLIGASRSTYPRVLTGKGPSVSLNRRNVFQEIDTFAKFDKRNGYEGMAPFILTNLKRQRKLLELEVKEDLKGFPDHAKLAHHLIGASCEFLQKLFEFAPRMRDELLSHGYGDGPYTPTAEKEAWDLCLLMLIVVFDTLWITRSEASHAYEHEDRSNFLYLSATLKCHMEMERFVRDGFSEHPAIMPKLLRHIFETFVSRADYRALADEVTDLKTTVTSLKRSIDTLSLQITRGGGGWSRWRGDGPCSEKEAKAR